MLKNHNFGKRGVFQVQGLRKEVFRNNDKIFEKYGTILEYKLYKYLLCLQS